jgi:hypothetical protein
MSTNITFNGVAYAVPAYSDTGYAQGAGNVSAYLIAIASGCLQQTGGNFTLTSPVNFGASNGLLSVYYASRTANPAATGVMRLANVTDAVSWRNFANSGDLPLSVNASNQLTFNGSPLASLITFNPSIVIVSDGAGALTSSTISTVTLGYLDATSSIQSQLNGKVAKAGDSMSGDLTMLTNHGIVLNDNQGSPVAVTLKAPATVTSAYTIRLPNTAGTNTYVMATDGSGNMSWVPNGTGVVGTGAQYDIPYYATAGTTLTASTNISVNASGDFQIKGGKNLQLDGSTSGNVKVQAAATTTSYAMILPNSQLSGVLSNDGSGNLSWGTNFNQFQKYTIGTASSPYTGSLTVYDLPFSYNTDAKSLQVFYNGQLLTPTDDYTETSSTRITTTSPLVSGGEVSFRTVTAGVLAATATLYREDYVVGTALNNYTGSTTVFNLVNSYTVAGNAMMVTLDGDVQTKGATVDYLETNSTTVTFNNALVSGQKVSFIWANTVGTTGVNAGTANQLAYYAASGGTVSGTPSISINGAEIIPSQSALGKVFTPTDATNNQKSFIAQNNGAASSALYIATNRDAATGTYTQTGQGSAQIQVQSANNSGQVLIKSANTNNGTLATVATFSENGVSVKGTTTNDSASSGNVGEYISASVSSANFAATGTYGDVTSISLTAGDWDVSITGNIIRNGATLTLVINGIGANAGNNFSDATAGNYGTHTAVSISDTTFPVNIGPFRVSLSGSATYYLKGRADYTVATPQVSDIRISARRVR